MIKRLVVLIFLASFSTVSFAQTQDMDKSSGSTTMPIKKPARDFLLLQLGYNTWAQKPDSVSTKGFGYSFSAFLCYDFPIKKTKLSFATGIGVNTNIIYLNNQVLSLADTGALGTQAHFLPDEVGYKKYKFVTTYLTAPFELRYFSNSNNRNRGFKAAIGMQIGTLLGAHTKGLRSVNGANVKDKVDTKNFVSTWNFAGTARIGWGHFSVYGSYNLTTVFKTNDGPAITPLSVGIALTGL